MKDTNNDESDGVIALLASMETRDEDETEESRGQGKEGNVYAEVVQQGVNIQSE